MCAAKLINRSLPSCVAVVLFATVLILSAVSPTNAAPVTFAFQATVGGLPPFNDDVGLPFTLEEGSVIDGRLTFDPDVPAEPSASTARTYIQPHSFEFSFGGFEFGAEQYEARVINDSGIIVEPSGEFIPADFITITCSTSSIDIECSEEMFPIDFPDTAPLRLGIRIQLAGDETLLSESVLPSDITVWNAFTIRRGISIGFVTDEKDGQLFNSTLSGFTPVPEPSTWYFLTVTISFLRHRIRFTR